MLTVKDLTVRAGNFELHGISFEIPVGSYAVLMGKTGSGKTTLLEAVCGLKPVKSGVIRAQDREITHLKPAQRGIGYVPQDGALFPTMSVYDNIAFALHLRNWERGAIRKRVMELADLLGIEALLERRPHGLSGGERQRVALGRALASRPGVLCLDEPLSALDEEIRAGMYSLLESVQHYTGATIVHVTHNLSEANRLADRVLRLKDGAMTIEETGSAVEQL